MIDTSEVMNKVMADNIVENIAQMSQEQRDLFVEVLTEKWPELANKLSINIESNLIEKDSNYDY